MLFHEGQSEVASDTHRFRVVCCGRRWGKTFLSIYEMVALAVSGDDKRIAYISPTYQQSRDIAWNLLKEISKPVQVNVNESRLEITLRTKDGGTSLIVLRGWEAIETLRGQAFDMLVIDEIASMRNWQYNWQNVLRPTLTDREGTALFISTPKGYNHFFDLFNKQNVDKDYASFQFSSYKNPHVKSSEIDKAKEELTTEAFSQEYMAEFRIMVGLAHQLWNRSIHLIKVFDVPDTWQRVRGFDYGSVDPTASTRVAVSPEGTWFLERCYKRAGAVIQDHAYKIKSQDFNLGSVPAWGDPSGSQWFKEFALHDLHIEPANKDKGNSKSWIEYGVEKINQMLKPKAGRVVRLPDGTEFQDSPNLFVLDTEENKAFVDEIETLKWKETKDGRNLPVLDEDSDRDGHSDLLAAFRYLAVSYNPINQNTLVDQFPTQDIFDEQGNPTI